MTVESDALLTKEQAAVHINVTIRTLERYVKSGIITPIRYGRAVRFRRQDLDNSTQLVIDKKNVLDRIREEMKKKPKEQSSWRNSVWFDPLQAHFLYNDCVVPYDTIQAFIREGTLRPKGYEDHQGIMMLRYTLCNQNLSL